MAAAVLALFAVGTAGAQIPPMGDSQQGGPIGAQEEPADGPAEQAAPPAAFKRAPVPRKKVAPKRRSGRRGKSYQRGRKSTRGLPQKTAPVTKEPPAAKKKPQDELILPVVPLTPITPEYT